MLRCSTLIFTIAICFVCTSDLFGQAEYSTGFPARLNDALQTKSSQAAAAAKKSIQQRPWLGESTAQRALAPRKSHRSSSQQSFRPQNKQIQTEQPQNKQLQTLAQPSFSSQSVKGTPFKPTPNYKRFESQRANADQSKPFTPKHQSRVQSNAPASFGPPSITPQPKKPKPETVQATPVSQERFIAQEKTVVQEKTVAQDKAVAQDTAFVQQPVLTPQPSTLQLNTPQLNTPNTPQPNIPAQSPIAPQEQITPEPASTLADIDPEIRREIEEQVKRDLEKKFETQIQKQVQKQVREQVKQAQQKMERAARNRIASRPLSSSTYRSPNAMRREAPIISGEVLPLIVPGNSKSAKPEQNHARYLITDSVPGDTYSSDYNFKRPNSPSQLNSPGTNRRDPQPVRERLNDGAETKPNTDTHAAVTATNQPQNEFQPKLQPQIQPNTQSDVYAAEGSSPLEEAAPPNPFLLRTSIVGPEALLEGQPDGYEIAISNISNQPATNVIVQLSVPDAITISRLDRDAYLDQKQRTVSWKVASIGAGQKEVIRYRAVSSTTGEHKQQVTLGMENTFQGETPFTTVVQAGAPQIPNSESQEYTQVAERPELEN